MAMDLSLRHLPDISEASSLPDFPDASFQIPRATNSTADYLLMAEPSDFLAGVGSETLTSPVKPTPRVHHVPLTLQELTPRTRRLRAAPIHSSLKRHVIPSPLKNAIARDLSVAINETLSPAKPRDLTFAIPMLSTPMTNLLEDDSFLQKARGVDTTFPEQSGSQRSHSTPLTLSQLTPTTSKDSDISPPPPPKYSLQIFQKEYDSLVNTSGSDTEATRLHNSPGMSSEPVIAEDKSSPPLSGLTTGPESSHALPDKPVGEGGLSAENVYKVERLKLARPAGSNTAHREKLKATKRTVIEGGVVKCIRKTSTSSGFTRNLTKFGKKSSATSHPGSTKRSAASVTTQEKSTKSLEISQITHPEGVTATAQVSDLDVSSHGEQTTVLSTNKSNSTIMGQEVPYGTMQNQDEGGLRRPDSVQEEMGPRSPQASSEQLAIRSDPDNDPTRSRPDETRHLSHMPPKSKAQDITPTSSLDCISDNNLVRHQAHIPSGVLDTANAENIDPGCSVVPPSPMRSSTKRSSSAALTQKQQRKRSKGASKGIPPIPYIHDTHDSKPCVTKKPSGFKNSASVSSSSSTTFVVGRSLCGSKTRSRQNLSSSRSRSGLRSTKVITTRSPPPSSGDFQGQTQLLSAGSSTGSIADRAFISSASSGSSAVGKSGDLPLVPPQDARLGGHRKMGDLLSASEPGPVVKTWSSINSYRPNISLPPAKPTKPIAFHFQSKARIEGRKAEYEERSKTSLRRSARTHGTLAIPDFKALHAANESQLAAKRVQIVPTIPVDFEFSTSTRAQEREKFEEARRAREIEAERLAEDRRRLQELEEEKEIKELRKRAIPKANEIPEWYAYAPKRLSHKEGKLGKGGPSVSC